jgi:hypothetical protein
MPLTRLFPHLHDNEPAHSHSRQSGYETPKKSVAFLQAGGSIRLLDTDIGFEASSGVMMCGKYQYVRSRTMTLHGVTVENAPNSSSFSLLDLPAVKGKEYSAAVPGYLAHTDGLALTYSFRNTALNHSLVLKGRFNAVSLVLEFSIHGER